MSVDVEALIERSLSQVFEREVRKRVDALVRHAFEDGSEFSKKLEQKIEQGFERVMDQGIQWEKKRPGFRKLEK